MDTPDLKSSSSTIPDMSNLQPEEELSRRRLELENIHSARCALAYVLELDVVGKDN